MNGALLFVNYIDLLYFVCVYQSVRLSIHICGFWFAIF